MRFFREYFLALCFAVFVGILAVLPSILAPFALGEDYRGVQFLYLDNEDHYRARIQEILDGHLAVASFHLYEYKNDSVIMPPINEYFYAIPALLFGLSFVMIASKFLFPAMLFFLAYFLVVNMIGREREYAKLAALTSGLLVIFGTELVNYQVSIPLLRGMNHETSLLLWTRPANPIIGALMIFGLLNLIWWVVARKYRYAYVGVGVLLAATVGYFFTLGISISILVSTIGIFILRKEYVIVKELGIALLISLIIDAPYWYNTLTAVGGEEGKMLAERNGLYFTHSPVFNKLLIATTLFFVISFCYSYYFKKDREYIEENSKVWLFMSALMLGSWIAFNQQIITGRAIWYHHFVQYTIPITLLVSVLVSYLVWRRYLRTLWFLGISIGVTLCLAVGTLYAFSYVYKVGDFRKLQQYAGAFDFLNTQAQKDCVVLIKENNEQFERLIPAYTHCNTYTTTSTFFGITNERVLHNYLLRLRLAGIDPEQAREYMEAHPEDIHIYFFTNWTNMFAEGADPWVLAQIPELVEKYRSFVQEDLKEQVLAYRMDYLASEAPISPSLKNELPGLTLATSTSRFYFYAF